jgi:hypothetical protein
MNFRKTLLSLLAAVGLIGSSFALFAPDANAQVRAAKRPDILLVVGGVAAAVLTIVLVTAGKGNDGNERPPVSP